jgi:membrane-associated phospholipid phosphatase
MRLWPVVVGWLVLLALALPFDAAITDWFHGVAPEGTYLRRAFKLPMHLFRWWSFVGLAAVLLFQPQRLRLLIGFAVAVAGCIGTLHAVKYVIGRARPDVTVDGVKCGPYHFHPFGDPREGYDSFPSGHAAQAVLLVALVGLYFPRLRWITLPFVLLVCLGRLALDRHFPSDVIGGAALGLFSVCLCFRWLGPSFYPRLWPAGRPTLGEGLIASR